MKAHNTHCIQQGNQLLLNETVLKIPIQKNQK